jgi:hypothetical protein
MHQFHVGKSIKYMFRNSRPSPVSLSLSFSAKVFHLYQEAEKKLDLQLFYKLLTWVKALKKMWLMWL